MSFSFKIYNIYILFFANANYNYIVRRRTRPQIYIFIYRAIDASRYENGGDRTRHAYILNVTLPTSPYIYHPIYIWKYARGPPYLFSTCAYAL